LWRSLPSGQVVARHASPAGFCATIQENFKDRIFALAELFLFNTALSAQLPCLTSLSLKTASPFLKYCTKKSIGLVIYNLNHYYEVMILFLIENYSFLIFYNLIVLTQK